MFPPLFSLWRTVKQVKLHSTTLNSVGQFYCHAQLNTQLPISSPPPASVYHRLSTRLHFPENTYCEPDVNELACSGVEGIVNVINHAFTAINGN